MDNELADGEWMVVCAGLHKSGHGKVAVAVSDRRASFEALVPLTFGMVVNFLRRMGCIKSSLFFHMVLDKKRFRKA